MVPERVDIVAGKPSGCPTASVTISDAVQRPSRTSTEQSRISKWANGFTVVPIGRKTEIAYLLIESRVNRPTHDTHTHTETRGEDNTVKRATVSSSQPTCNGGTAPARQGKPWV